MTEMLKGTLEGIVLAILRGRPAYGYEITAWLREQGFSDIAEGTVYALLIRIEQRGYVDVQKVPSEKGPPRKVYSLNARGQQYLGKSYGGRGASSPTGSNSSIKGVDDHVHLKLRGGEDRREATLGGRYKARVKVLPEPYRTAVGRDRALPHVLLGVETAPDGRSKSSRTSPTCSEQAAADGDTDPPDRGGGPRGVRRGIRPELPGGAGVDHPGEAGTADEQHRARRR